jgi:two-component system phosphate regulon sensor histidine kinase PhoR
VEDTGVGIPKEAQSRVFQRFFRVDPSRSKESGGYGLGLAIAQTIVHQHKASIELQSKSSGGCIFSVSLAVAA